MADPGPLVPFWEEDFSTWTPSKYYRQVTPGSGEISGTTFLLTKDATSQFSRIFYLTPTLMSEFTASFRLNFGSSISPGDGIVFAICPHYSYMPRLLVGTADAQCPGGYMLDFDTYEGSGSEPNRVYIAYEHQAARLAQADVASLTTGLWYTFTVTFDHGTWNVDQDGNRVLTDAAIPDYVPFWGYFGFAADTGPATSSPQQVDDIQVFAPAAPAGVSEVWVDGAFTPSSPGWGVTATNSLSRAMWLVQPPGVVHVLTGSYATTWLMPLAGGGHYTPTLWLRPGVSILGRGPWATMLDGQGRNRTVMGYYSALTATDVFSGFTVRGGRINDPFTQSGGGLDLWSGSETIVNCRVISNVGYYGGGISLVRSSATLINNMVADNLAQSSYSGIRLYYPQGVRLLHTTVARNTGGEGSGVRQNGDGSSTAFLTNTVVAGQAVGVQVVAGTATLDGVLWGNGAWANDANTNGAIDVSNAVTGTPAFVDPAAGDYHIGAGSAARDAAITTNPPVGDDIDGQPRPQGSQPDLGADEYWPPPCATLSAVGLAGPITGTAGTGLPFTATVSPPTATLPITYTWQATGQTPVTQTIPVTQSDVVFAWPLSGTQAITVAAINCSDWLTATRLITVETLPGQACTPLSDVGLGGPSTGITGTVYLFTATANPPTATLPITFSWQTAGLSPLTQTVPVTRTIAAFIWGITGTQAITLAAANCGSAVSTTGVITIEGESGPVVIPGHGVYLPMISCPAQ